MNRQFHESVVPAHDAGVAAAMPPQAGAAPRVAGVEGAASAVDTGRPARWFTLLVLGGPMLAFGLCLVAMGWYDPAAGALRHPGSVGQMAGALLCSSLGVALAGFWPFHLFAGRQRPSRRQ